jgi:hypothetical protein
MIADSNFDDGVIKKAVRVSRIAIRDLRIEMRVSFERENEARAVTACITGSLILEGFAFDPARSPRISGFENFG